MTKMRSCIRCNKGA